MIGDPWPEEPDEPLVEKYRESDPEEELAPEPPSPEEIPRDLYRTFWGLVALINVGLFAASLGLMLVGFRGEWRRGGAVFLLGVAALALAGYRYRRYTSDDGGDGDATDSGGGNGSEGRDADGNGNGDATDRKG